MPYSAQISFELFLGYPQATCNINYSVMIGLGPLDKRNVLNKSKNNNPSMQVTEALHQKEKILPNFYILDSFPSVSLLPKCLEQSKVKGNFV